MKNIITCFAILCCFHFVSFSQEVALEEIISTYLENIGGAEKWKTVKSMALEGTVTSPMGSYNITLQTMEPNLMKLSFDIQGTHLVQAFDGTNAWFINPFTGEEGAQKGTDEEAKERAKQLFHDDFIDYQEKGSIAELTGEAEIEGTPTYEVKLNRFDGEVIYYYFDKEALILIKSRQFVDHGEMKGLAVDTYVSNYDEVEGLMVPFSIKQTIDDQLLMEVIAEKVFINPTDVSEENFLFPQGGE